LNLLLKLAAEQSGLLPVTGLLSFGRVILIYNVTLRKKTMLLAIPFHFFFVVPSFGQMWKSEFNFCSQSVGVIQDVSEIRVLILTSERTRQPMKLFSMTFCKIRKSIPKFFAP
jgi:hypothetical protein